MALVETTPLVVGICTGTCALIVGAMAPFGIDIVTLGTGMTGALVARVLVTKRKSDNGEQDEPPVSKWEIVNVTLASMFVASFAAPWFTPWLFALGVKLHANIDLVHAKACAGFVAGMFPKPLLVLAQMGFQAAHTFVSRFLAKGGEGQ